MATNYLLPIALMLMSCLLLLLVLRKVVSLKFSGNLKEWDIKLELEFDEDDDNDNSPPNLIDKPGQRAE